MGNEQASAYCKYCDKQVLVLRESPNHLLHFLLSIVTFGIWLLIWWFVASEKKPWRCSNCGMSLGGGSNGWGLMGSLLSKKPDSFDKFASNSKEDHGVIKKTNKPVIINGVPIYINDAPSIDNETKKCPTCAERINVEAIKCRFCGYDFDPTVVDAEVKERAKNLNKRNQINQSLATKNSGLS